MKISTLSDEELMALAMQAHGDPALKVSLLGLSAQQGVAECKRVDKALGIEANERQTVLLLSLSRLVG